MGVSWKSLGSMAGFVCRAKVDPLKLFNSGFSGSGLSRCGVSLGNVGLHVAEQNVLSSVLVSRHLP